MSSQLTVKDHFNSKSVQKRFTELLDKEAQGFITSVLQVWQNNSLLQKASPETVLNAAATAAALKLPINQSLGYAYIVPYKGQAQFQIGWKGLVQLAQRTGQYLSINAIEVYENQFKSFNALTEELDADFSEDGEGKIVGYCSYFKLANGFEKTVYWSLKKVTNHAKKFSQSYGKSFSPWSDKDNFHEMAKKTVLKNALSKWGILSIEMQKAVTFDQSVQKKEDEPIYVDNGENEKVDEVSLRVESMINKASTIDELEMLSDDIDDSNVDLFNQRKEELK